MWSVEFLGGSEKDLAKFDRAARCRIIEKIEWLRENFDFVLPISLRAEFSDFFIGLDHLAINFFDFFNYLVDRPS